MKAAVVQLNSGANVDENIATADSHVRGAAADGASLIVLPEKWTVMGGEAELRAGAQTLDGNAIEWAREVAQELDVDLVAGSIAERIPGHDLLSNTSVHVGPDGEIRAVYRKLHMFDVEVDGRQYRESDTDEPGDDIVSSELVDGTKLGMSICYDLRFPEVSRILALRGARVIVLPAAFTLLTTRDHWASLIRARAIENQVYVVAANQDGTHPGNHRSGGHSMIVDPWGIVLAEAPDGVGHATAELDFERQSQIRKRLPVFEHRRPYSYSWPRPSEPPPHRFDSRVWPEGTGW
jgi:deaminated glutathione amidase